MSKSFWKTILLLLLICVIYLAFLSFYPHPSSLQPGSNSSNQSQPEPTTPIATPTPALVTIGLVGDLGLGRHITSTARSKNDFSWSFQGTTGWLIQNDFNLANLESPIIDNCPHGPTGTFTFCGDTRFLPYLQQNKFFFNLSNNHILNYGQSGLTQTKNYLNQIQVPFVYSHSPQSEFTRHSANGITLGLLGYDFVTYPDFDQKSVLDKVEQYNSQVDWLIVSIHWGNEYLPQPETWRVKFAHQLIDAGADIIHGHHPHVWQEPETYNGKLIYYSFGNFIFDQSWSYETSHTNIVRLTLTQNEVVDNQTFPVEIKFNSQPVLLPRPTSSLL